MIFGVNEFQLFRLFIKGGREGFRVNFESMFLYLMGCPAVAGLCPLLKKKKKTNVTAKHT